jgi:hypothetical protein
LSWENTKYMNYFLILACAALLSLVKFFLYLKLKNLL